MKSEIAQFLGKTVEIEIDRPLGSKHPKYDWIYPINYGFVPNTKNADGKEIDAYLLGVGESIEKYTGKCIAIIHRKDDDDDKLVIAPVDHQGFTDEEIKEQTYFQEQFFTSEIYK